MGSAFGAAHGALDLSDPSGLLTAAVRLRASTNGALAFVWLSGVRFGVVDTKLTPLYGLKSCTMSYFNAAEDGTYKGRSLEVAYHSDLETNQRLETFRNPFTGETVDVPLTRTGPVNVILNAGGVVLPEFIGTKRVVIESEFRPATVRGDRVWIRFDSRSQVFDEGATEPSVLYSEMTTYGGRLSDLNNPDLTLVPSGRSYSSVTSWRPWLENGGIDGHTTANATGDKVARLDDLPADILDFIKAEHPDIYADPQGVLDSDAAFMSDL
jgi:hypothetical protein